MINKDDAIDSDNDDYGITGKKASSFPRMNVRGSLGNETIGHDENGIT